MSTRFFKRTLPSILTFIFGISMLIPYYFKVPKEISTTVTAMTKWGIIISAFAMGLAAANLLTYHYSVIKKREKTDWLFSSWSILTFLVMTFLGLAYGRKSYWYTWWWNNTVSPVSATLMGMWIVYMVAASFRTYRMRTLESSALGLTVLVIMLRNMTLPFAAPFGVIGDWLMSVPTLGGSRAVVIGIAIGTLITGIRRLIGAERAGIEEAMEVGE